MAEPIIRFKDNNGCEYSDWIECQLQDIVERITRKNKNNETDIPLTISSLGGLVDQRTYFGKTIASRDMSGYYLLQNGEFAYNKSYSVGFDFGSIKRLDKYYQGALSTLYICFALKDKSISDYMTHYFNSLVWNKEMPKICAEGARNHGLLNVSPADFFKININMPASAEEREKIVSLLNEVELLVSTLTEEVRLWEENKKGVMQKIFSQEVRFKDENGEDYPEWEEKTLGDLGTVKMCKRVLKEQTSNIGEIPFYKIGTFGNVPDAYISRNLFNELKKKYSFPRRGDILLSAAGTIGRTVVYDGEDAFFQDSNIVWLEHDETIKSEFLYQFYKKTNWENLEGGTIKRLYNSLLLAKEIMLPCLEEQQKIADCLSSIDEVIAIKKQKLETWKNIKKGLLQQMFV